MVKLGMKLSHYFKISNRLLKIRNYLHKCSNAINKVKFSRRLWFGRDIRRK